MICDNCLTFVVQDLLSHGPVGRQFKRRPSESIALLLLHWYKCSLNISISVTIADKTT